MSDAGSAGVNPPLDCFPSPALAPREASFWQTPPVIAQTLPVIAGAAPCYAERDARQQGIAITRLCGY
jgi:hypothetical protein